jgi:hypothetical protein
MLQKPVRFYRRAAATHSKKMFQGNTPHRKLQKPVCLYRRAAATHSNKMFQGKTVRLNRRPPRHTAHNPLKKSACNNRRAAATHSNKMFKRKTVCLNRRPRRHTEHNPIRNLRASITKKPQHTARKCCREKLFPSPAGSPQTPETLALSPLAE